MQQHLLLNKFDYIDNIDNKIKGYHFDDIIWNNCSPSFIGVDEVGRGPLAGPVVSAAVILDPKKKINGLDDSKKICQKKRDILFDAIKKKSFKISLSFVFNDDIDKLNILKASLLAMQKAILKLKSDFPVIVDGKFKISGIRNVQKCIIKGDSKSASISAASIVAKVIRDRYMLKMAKRYPLYGFEKHKGYPTKYHFKMLRQYGPCLIHRKSFKGVIL